MFQWILICFLEFYHVSNRYKRSFFFKAVTAVFHILQYIKTREIVKNLDISGVCLEISNVSTDSESSHL